MREEPRDPFGRDEEGSAGDPSFVPSAGRRAKGGEETRDTAGPPRGAEPSAAEVEPGGRQQEGAGIPDQPAEAEPASLSRRARRGPVLGPRRAALAARRRARRRRLFLWTLSSLLVAAVVGAGTWRYVHENGGDDGVPRPAATPTAPAEPRLSALLFGAPRPGAPATFLTLLWAEEDGATSVVYIPATTAVEVPGRGLQGVGEALASGGPALLQVATENLLGIDIGVHAQLTASDLERLMTAVGPLTVDVPHEVSVAAGKDRARLAFSSGRQDLSPTELTELLFTLGIEGDQVELGSRHLAVWDALLDAFGARPESLAARVKTAGLDLGEEARGHLGALLQALAAAEPARRRLAILPVRQVSAGGDELYAADRDEVEAFLSETLDIPAWAELVAVQILNGNGVPGIGQEVAERLVGRGFRVVLTGNAPRLDYRHTRIVTYDRSEAGIRAARRARELLGVGRIQVSGQEQVSVVLTIVVGEDFVGKTDIS